MRLLSARKNHAGVCKRNAARSRADAAVSHALLGRAGSEDGESFSWQGQGMAQYNTLPGSLTELRPVPHHVKDIIGAGEGGCQESCP